MKMKERINGYRKDFVYEQYTRIVEKFKYYEKITRVKMIDEIYAVYSDYNNIIDICTARELKYLKMIIEGTAPEEQIDFHNPHSKSKYNWEKRTLQNKFLISNIYNLKGDIPEEIVDQVKKAVKSVKWNEKKKKDDINELLVSYCKILGETLIQPILSFGSAILSISAKELWDHIINDRVFNYYVFITTRNIENLGEKIPVAIYQSFYDIEDELIEQRKMQGLSGTVPIDIRDYETLFYNDFNINNSKIRKFVYELEELPFFWSACIPYIMESAMLNARRASLKELISNVPSLKNIDLSNFFKTMDEAMDEMPSGALNGFTPNQARREKLEKERKLKEKKSAYVKQKNACLSKDDSKLFFKIYNALLDFTNKKYKLYPKLRIFNKRLNVEEAYNLAEKFYENKDSILQEFCLSNSYKFNQEELKMTNEFKNIIRSMFIICKYEDDYTGFMHNDRVYMVKGLTNNIDTIIPYTQLPYPVVTTIIPFKGYLVYDGILSSMNIKLGNSFDDIIAKEYNNLMKYYHL